MTTPKQRALQALQSQVASNPIGLANTLAAWGKDILANEGGTNGVRNDPGCRLLTYQLAFLMGVDDGCDYANLYLQATTLAES